MRARVLIYWGLINVTMSSKDNDARACLVFAKIEHTVESHVLPAPSLKPNQSSGHFLGWRSGLVLLAVSVQWRGNRGVGLGVGDCLNQEDITRTSVWGQHVKSFSCRCLLARRCRYRCHCLSFVFLDFALFWLFFLFRFCVFAFLCF